MGKKGRKEYFALYNLIYLLKGACVFTHILTVRSYLLTHFTTHINKLKESRMEGKRRQLKYPILLTQKFIIKQFELSITSIYFGITNLEKDLIIAVICNFINNQSCMK